jgi:hypothetical protein
MMAVHRLQDAMGQSASQRAEQDEKAKLRGEVEQYKREAEEVGRMIEFASAKLWASLLMFSYPL